MLGGCIRISSVLMNRRELTNVSNVSRRVFNDGQAIASVLLKFCGRASSFQRPIRCISFLWKRYDISSGGNHFCMISRSFLLRSLLWHPWGLPQNPARSWWGVPPLISRSVWHCVGLSYYVVLYTHLLRQLPLSMSMERWGPKEVTPLTESWDFTRINLKNVRKRSQSYIMERLGGAALGERLS